MYRLTVCGPFLSVASWSVVLLSLGRDTATCNMFATSYMSVSYLSSFLIFLFVWCSKLSLEHLACPTCERTNPKRTNLKRGNSAASKGDHLEMMIHQALRDLNVSNSTPKMPSRWLIEEWFETDFSIKPTWYLGSRPFWDRQTQIKEGNFWILNFNGAKFLRRNRLASKSPSTRQKHRSTPTFVSVEILWKPWYLCCFFVGTKRINFWVAKGCQEVYLIHLCDWNQWGTSMSSDYGVFFSESFRKSLVQFGTSRSQMQHFLIRHLVWGVES